MLNNTINKDFKTSRSIKLIIAVFILSVIISLLIPFDASAKTKTTKSNEVYTIKFNGNTATSGKMSALKNRKFNKTYTLPKVNYKKKGYSFKGWATSKSGSVKYKDKAKIKNLAKKNKKSITLYAVWKKEKKKKFNNPYLAITYYFGNSWSDVSYIYYVNDSVKDDFSIPANSTIYMDLDINNIASFSSSNKTIAYPYWQTLGKDFRIDTSKTGSATVKIKYKSGDIKSIKIKVTGTSNMDKYNRQNQIDTWLSSNITSSMSTMDKVKKIGSHLTNEVLTDKDDCVVTANEINIYCNRIGIESFTRFAVNDKVNYGQLYPGSNHHNNLIVIDGIKYVVDYSYRNSEPILFNEFDSALYEQKYVENSGLNNLNKWRKNYR